MKIAIFVLRINRIYSKLMSDSESTASKGNVTRDTFPNFGTVCTYLKTKRFAWKRSCIRSPKLLNPLR